MPRTSTKNTKAAPKKTVKKEAVQNVETVEETPKAGVNFFDYLRFGESYTSLILGIIVVIISTALLLSFVHNKNTGAANPSQQSKTVAQGNNYQISTLPTLTPIKASEAPSATVEPTATVVPTKVPTVAPTKVPTVVPTKKVQATVAPTKKVEPTVAPKPTATPAPVVAKGGEYVVKSGDTLWSIAEAQYKSGYNWVDIARANNLSNPGMINAGNKLVLPKVATKTPTVDTQKTVVTNDEHNNRTVAQAPVSDKISGDTYKIVRGDNLWNIAVRAYGDGYKWVDIARANNLTNPGLIHADNVLKIPRGK